MTEEDDEDENTSSSSNANCSPPNPPLAATSCKRRVESSAGVEPDVEETEDMGAVGVGDRADIADMDAVRQYMAQRTPSV
jgi:hypothetical protein